jgi:hypothetical protein
MFVSSWVERRINRGVALGSSFSKCSDKTLTLFADGQASRCQCFDRDRDQFMQAVAERFRVQPLGEACKRSRRSIQKSRDAAAIINIAAKKQPLPWRDRPSPGWSVPSWKFSQASRGAGSSRSSPSRASLPNNPPKNRPKNLYAGGVNDRPNASVATITSCAWAH